MDTNNPLPSTTEVSTKRVFMLLLVFSVRPGVTSVSIFQDNGVRNDGKNKVRPLLQTKCHESLFFAVDMF